MKRAQQIANATSQGTSANPIPTIGGEDFPQNTPITININGGLFTGSFVGNNFYVTSSVHPDNETAAQQAANDSRDPCPPPPPKAQDYDYKMDVPCGCGDFFNECQLRRQGWVITTSVGSSRSASSSSVMQQFWADPGSRIVMESDSPLTYVISIVPGRFLPSGVQAISRASDSVPGAAQLLHRADSAVRHDHRRPDRDEQATELLYHRRDQ